jgi:hypothetical protein
VAEPRVRVRVRITLFLSARREVVQPKGGRAKAADAFSAVVLVAVDVSLLLGFAVVGLLLFDSACPWSRLPRIQHVCLMFHRRRSLRFAFALIFFEKLSDLSCRLLVLGVESSR